VNSRYLSTEFEIRTSPHFTRGMSVEVIMRNVIYALIPIILVSVYYFGLSAALLITTTSLSCLLSEKVVCIIAKKDNTLSDYSAFITGILLGLTLPPGFPLWMAALGSIIAILIGKSVFGGLGFNIFNPALVGRAFLQAAFPVAITTWNVPLIHDRFTTLISTTITFPFLKPVPDSISGATPLALMKFEQTISEVQDLFLGMTSGSTGETCAILVILGGIYLALRKMLDPRIPVAIFSSTFILSSIFYLVDSTKYPSPLFMIFSGGLALGAVFMATDMVTSPVTPKGTWLYGILIGCLIVIIRLFGGLPEGVMYAILLGNALTPIINQLLTTKVYGVNLKRNKKKDG